MPDVLTEAAPSVSPAVPSVEVDAPETSIGEVGDGSTPTQENLIPKARFDGLMGRFHQEQQARKDAEAELESLRAQQQRPEETQPVTEQNSDQLQALQEQVSALTTILQQQSTKTARELTLEKFPDVAPFADLIVGETQEDFDTMAEILHERITGLKPAVEPEGDPEPEPGTDAPATAGTTDEPVAPTAPVTGGGVPSSGENAADERVSEAIKSGNFTEFLHAQWEKQALADPDHDLVLEGS